MPEEDVSRCPFQPTQPVDLQFFVGRADLITTIKRVADQTYHSKSGVAAIYLGGVGRIGKTSLANFSKVGIEQLYKAFGFHVLLGGNYGTKNSEQFFQRVVTSMIQEKNTEPTVMSRIEKIFKHVILEVSVGVVKVNTKELQASLPQNGASFISFLGEFGKKLQTEKNRGFVLILDEIDGIAAEPFFATFLKELFDAAGLVATKKQFPLLVIICGTMEKFLAIKSNNSRVAELLTLIAVSPLPDSDVKLFFQKAFRYAGQDITEDALEILVEFSNGMPQLMHFVGEATFFVSQRDRAISSQDACRGVAVAAENYGSKIVNPLIHGLLDDDNYATLFEHLCDPHTHMAFTRRDLVAKAGTSKARHVDALLHRLSHLKVIEKAGKIGEWKFIDPMVSVYLHMLKMRHVCSTAWKSR